MCEYIPLTRFNLFLLHLVMLRARFLCNFAVFLVRSLEVVRGEVEKIQEAGSMSLRIPKVCDEVLCYTFSITGFTYMESGSR